MADRTSAALFGMFFEFLAENPDERNKAMAQRIWEQKGDYDFSPYQIEADDALITLGLAKTILYDPDDGDSEVVVYRGTREWRD